MAVTYSTAAKNARLDAVIGLIDGGAASPANGYIEIGTAGMASVLATITLALPCGSAAAGVLTFTMPQSDASADNGGTAAAARIRDAAGTDVITGLTVGTAATSPLADITLDNTSISAGQTVTINSATITHA